MKKPLVLMLHLVVPWLCLASAALLLASQTADAQALYPQVKFSTVWVTPETYNSFIDSVRAALVTTAGGESNGIPVLLSEDDPLALQTFLNITLVNKAGQSISLKMDVTGAYFTAYDAGKYSCLIKSGTCWSDPFSSSVAKLLESSSGDSLIPAGGVAGAGDDGRLGAATWRAKDLDQAISSLFLFATGKAANEDLKRGVATCDMMIATAAKFPYIQRRISAGMWDDGSCVSDGDGSLGSLQERWPALSSAVQLSYQGAFAAEVKIQRSNGSWLRVDNVRRAAPLVSFLQHDKCNKALQVEPSSSASSSPQIPMVIRSVVQDAAEMGSGAPTPATCGQAEPTMHIVGPEGKCVDVPYSSYVARTQVIIWPCRSNDIDDMNQLWTFKRDGTIRCNGMCLASSSTNVAGATVVIDNCRRVPRSRGVWEARADGTIALKNSYLVLAVTSSADRTGVTVQFDDRGTGQSWTPTNDTAPLVTAIRGYRDLCLQVDRAGAVVSAATCGGAGAEWALYPDGSVRPSGTSTRCLAPDAAGRVVVSACDLAGSSNQRWVFRNDGTVYNSGTEGVMTVRPRLADPGCVVSAWEVIVSPGTGSPTQNWSIML